ncbi:hypothetical protein ACFY4C_40890 [Actinomadura viridis]|uniref:hypothetical protein n=1 Tax=Actinomadura viridis TaxID=58110 RepID=UPI00368A98EF
MRREGRRPAGTRSARVVRAGARGLVAAMAMSGVRSFTAAFAGPHEKTPPEAVVEAHAPESVQRLPRRGREAVTELVHWTYGTGGGMVFGLLPARVRLHPVTGPLYGLVIWFGFELALAPVLGLRHTRRHPVLWRVVIALDHVLYGVVVAGRLAPEPPRTRRPAWSACSTAARPRLRGGRGARRAAAWRARRR